MNILFFRLPSLLYKKERKRKKNLPLNQKINISFYIQIPYYTAIGRFKSRSLQKIIIEYFLGFYSFPLMGKVRETINQPFGLFKIKYSLREYFSLKKIPSKRQLVDSNPGPSKKLLIEYFGLLFSPLVGKTREGL